LHYASLIVGLNIVNTHEMTFMETVVMDSRSRIEINLTKQTPLKAATH